MGDVLMRLRLPEAVILEGLVTLFEVLHTKSGLEPALLQGEIPVFPGGEFPAGFSCLSGECSKNINQLARNATGQKGEP